MEIPVEVIAFHGWGLDSRMWEPLKNRLPSVVSFKTTDSGYFGNEQKAEFNSQVRTRILFSHSYGLHKIPVSLLLESEHIVVFNGFRSFSEQNSNRGRVIDRMIRAFQRDPGSTLMEFYRNCGIHQEDDKPFDSLSTDRLRYDLEQMKNNIFEVPDGVTATWTFIDSADDRIIPGRRGHELHKLVDRSEYRVLEGSDHVIPITKSEECGRILYESIPIFRST